MEKRWSSDTYNGNTDSASDLEAPCDFYPVVEVDRGIQRDGSGVQPPGSMEGHRNLSNITPQNGQGVNYHQSQSATENEYVNASTIIDPMPRKKPVLSLDTLPENAYVNIDAFNGRRPCSLGTDQLSSVRVMDSSSNRPSSSAGSSSGQGLTDKSSKIVLITSPNNNTETIPFSTTSTGSSRSQDLVILKGPIVDCPTPCESKSAWQFYLKYGTAEQQMESSEETPSPSSEASPNVVLSEGSIDSLSEEDDGFGSTQYLALRDSDKVCSPQSQSDFLLNDASQKDEAMLSPSSEILNSNKTGCLRDVLPDSVTDGDYGTSTPVQNSGAPVRPEDTHVKLNNLAMSPYDTSRLSVSSVSALNVTPFANVDFDNMGDVFSDSSASSTGSNSLAPQVLPSGHSAGIDDLSRNTEIKNADREARLIQHVKPRLPQNFDRNRGMVKSRSSQNYKCSSTPAERFVSLQGFLDPVQGASPQRPLQSAPTVSNRPQALPVSADRFCCWQQSSEPLHTCRRTKRPLSLHELEQRSNFFPGESSSGHLESGSPRCSCTSRQTQTENGRPYMLRQSNSFSAMPGSSSWWGRRQDDHREGVKTGSKVNLGVSSLRSAYPVVRRQPGLSFPTSQTAENLRVVNALGSSQSTPSFVGLCRMNCPSKRRGQFESPMSRETGWRYTRPVSDSGLFIKHARFGSSRTKNNVPDFLNQISERNQASIAKPTADDVERRNPSSNRVKRFARRLSDPSYSLPQPPRRSASLSGKILLIRSLSEPHMKNCSQPVARCDDRVSQLASTLMTEHPAIIYENLPRTTENRIEFENMQCRPAESSSEAQSVALATYENVKAANTKTRESTGDEPMNLSVDEAVTVPKTSFSDRTAERFHEDFYNSFSSDSLDSDSSSEDCIMEERPNLGNSDSFDSETEDESDSGDNYAGSSEDSSDTISMDDLLTRLGVVTAQDGDADDEDGFLDSSDDEEEEELLLPVTAPSRMCDRPPSPYPGLGDSSDDEHPLSISTLFEVRSRSTRESGTLETPDHHRRPPLPVRSRTEQDFLEFEILNLEDYGLEHPPSYTDLFPVGMPGLPEMPPSYDDAVRPISVHQDHFDYASFQDHRVNNRLSLQLPWGPPGEEYLSNPPPAYDDAVFNASGGRSHDELSYHSPSDSPVRRSRGRRILNGLRRFARKIFK
ncbi:uncharacterized protein LOC135462703 [Liolophura sinensis]|uniref:uncharacterized protein LOC135462703 n=1 Tax=Liolophura sinensis TaxID=3198878 RepID=UPI0031582FEF